MGWDTNQSGTRFYTQSYREGGKVKRRYIGIGILGELAAMADEERRLDAEIAREEEQAEQARIAAIDAPLEAWHQSVMDTVAAALVGAGFHQHKSQWRRKRDCKEG